MTEANPKGSPQERLIHYLEMATRAHEAARGPHTEVRIRNLYLWVAKSWELLAMDEIEKLKLASRAERQTRKRLPPRPRSRSGHESHLR